MDTTKKIFILICFLLFSILSSSNILGQNNSFVFLVISDVHISNDTSRDNKLKKFVEEINNKKFGNVDLLVVTGDIVSSYFSDRNKPNDIRNNRSLKVAAILAKLKIPYYLGLGNHDYKIDKNKDSDEPFSFQEIYKMETLWKKSAGIKPYCKFEHKGWKFILLNSMRGRYLDRFFDNDQMKMLKDELSGGGPAFLFFHHPIKTDHFRIWCKPGDLITEKREPEFFSILRKYRNQIKGIFVGHGHMWNDDVLYDSIKVYETNTFGERKGQSFYTVEPKIGGDNFKIKKFEKK